MDIQRIGSSFTPNAANEIVNDTNVNGKAFIQFFDASMKMLEETNEYQKDAEIAQLDFLTGKNENLLDVVIAQEKAYSSLQFTVQVTNKILSAYQEIMRIQI